MPRPISARTAAHVAGAIDGNEETGWAVSPQFGKSHEAIFETKDDAGATGGSVLTITISQQYPDGKHLLGKFRLSVTDGTRPLSRRSCPRPSPPRSPCRRTSGRPSKLAAIAAHYRTLDADLERLSAAAKTAGDQAKNARRGIQDLAWA